MSIGAERIRWLHGSSRKVSYTTRLQHRSECRRREPDRHDNGVIPWETVHNHCVSVFHRGKTDEQLDIGSDVGAVGGGAAFRSLSKPASRLTRTPECFRESKIGINELRLISGLQTQHTNAKPLRYPASRSSKKMTGTYSRTRQS